jgi:hypothetical protein
MTKIVTDNRARQGGKGRPVLMVLLGSLLLLGVSLIGLMTWMGGEPRGSSPSTDAARSTASSGPSGSSSNPSDRTPSANPAYPAPADPTATGTTNRSGTR